MSSCGPRHMKVDETGAGLCSVPMWMGGCPSGFCDRPAYGPPVPSKLYRDGWTGRTFRADGKYDGYVPGLACEGHGGPPPRHLGDPCQFCATPHDDVAPGPCPRTAVAA